MGYTVASLRKGPVHVVSLGWALTATFVLLYVLCWLAAILFPDLNLTHAWLGLYSTAPAGSVRGLVEGIIWNVVFAWIAAITFGVTYNSLAPLRSLFSEKLAQPLKQRRSPRLDDAECNRGRLPSGLQRLPSCRPS